MKNEGGVELKSVVGRGKDVQDDAPRAFKPPCS